MTKRNWLLLAMCALLICTCALITSCDFGNIGGGEGGGATGDTGTGNNGEIIQDEYYIVDVQMVTPPTISNYGEGDIFDPTGMVLKVIWNDGWEQLVTDGKNCIFSPAGPISADTEEITATYDDKVFTLPVNVNRLTGIKVVSQPARKLYAEGEAFSVVGMQIVGLLENSEDGKIITDYTLSDNAASLSPSDTKVTVSYARGGHNYSCDIPVTVVSKDAVVVIEAESGTVTKGEKVTNSALLKYASGNSFVRNLKEGGTIVINVPSAKATTASIRFVAASYEDALDEAGNKLSYTMPLKINEYMTVSFNGVEIEISDAAILPGGYDDDRGNLSRYCHWYEISLDDVQLNDGDNYFVITSLVDMSKNNTKDPGNAELNDYHSTLFDCLRVFYADVDAVPKEEDPGNSGETLTEKTYQAEDLTLNGITTVVKANGNSSGLFNTMIANGDKDPGFIKNFTSGSTLTLNINLAAATKVRISIFGSSTLGTDVTAAALIKGVTLNGTAITHNSGVCFPKNDKSVASMATFLEYVLGEFDFAAGENTLVITFNATEACFIDRLVLADATLAACTHTNKTSVGEAKDATCTETGLTAGVKCDDCGKVLEEQEVIGKTAHTPAEAVKENEVKPTCTEPGSYDMVVYCSVCKTYEISKTSHTSQPTDHSYTDNYDASCNNEGCGYVRDINCEHTYEGVVTTKPTPSAEGVKTFTCSKCGDSYTEAIEKLLEVVYEMEKGVVVGGSIVPDGKSGLTKFMSGKGFVRNLGLGATITITVVMDDATTGNIIFVMSSHEDNGGKLAETLPVNVKEAITVTINGVNYAIGDDAILPGGPNYDFDGDGTVDNLTKHCHWYELVFEDVALNAGENTIVITAIADSSETTDYMKDLHSAIYDCVKVHYVNMPHTHAPSTEWEHDETHHWHDCVADDGQEYDKAEHSYDNACDTTCDCGYVRTVYHDFTGDFTYDADGHWHICKTEGCDVTDTKQPHSWNDGDITTKPTVDAEGVKTYTCTDCGATYTESVAKFTEVIIEAEDSVVVNGTKATSGNVRKYASGTSFVANLKEGGTITITIPSTKATTATLRFVMSSYEDALDESGNKLTSTMDLKVNEYLTFTLNGQTITVGDDFILRGGSDYDINGDGAVDNLTRFCHFYELVIEDVELKAGDNTFVITSLVDMSDANKEDLHSTIFDCMKVHYTDASAIPQLETTYQAEKQNLSGITTVVKANGNSSGLFTYMEAAGDTAPGFIKDFTAGSTITLIMNSPEATKVKISVWGSSTGTSAMTTATLIKGITLNGDSLTYSTGTCFPALSTANAQNMADFKEFVLGEYELRAGTNYLIITFNKTSACFIDRIVVTPVEE